MVRVKLTLIRNPKVSGKFFVAKIDLEKEEIQFVKPVVYEYDDRGRYMIGGEYEFQVGDYIIAKYDLSSHRNTRIRYVLYRVENDLKELASIEIYNRAKEFTPEILKDIYTSVSVDGNGSRIIKALVKYAKQIAKKPSHEELFKALLNEIMDIVRKYEEKLAGYTPYHNLKNQLETTLKSMEG